MTSEKFYLVDKKSVTHRIITEMYAKRDSGMKARWKFVNEHFPESKKKKSGYMVASWSSPLGRDGDWGVQLPQDESGCIVIPNPADWKFAHRTHNCIQPKVSSKRGKELAAEMKRDQYAYPSAADFGYAIGIKPHINGMFQVRSPGFMPTNDGRYIVTLYGDMEPVDGMSRISDIDAEKLLEKKTAKPAAKRKKPAKE